MKSVRQRHSLLIPFFLVPAVVLGGLLPSLSAPAQTPPPTFEELVARVELLRSRQEVLTSDASDFKADVAEATATLRAERQAAIAAEDAALRADMAAEDSAIRAEMATEVSGLRTDLQAWNSLAAADGSPAQAVYVDDSGRVGIGTTDPQKKLHVAGNASVSGNLDVGGDLKGSPVPDFDSGWFLVNNNATYPQTHNLNLDDLPSLIQIYVSDKANPVIGADTIYLMNQAQFYYNTSHNMSGMGVYVKIVDSNTIDIMTGQTWVFFALTAGEPDGPAWENAKYLRVRVWK